MCRSLKSNVQANGLYKRPQILHLQLDTGGVVMTSAQVAEQIKSIFPLFYIQGRSSRVIIDLRCSSFFIMQTDMLYTKKRKSLNFNNSRTYNFIFCFQRRDRLSNLHIQEISQNCKSLIIMCYLECVVNLNLSEYLLLF